MYRGGLSMWTWIFHRVTGIGILVFLFAHIIDTVSIGWGPEVYNTVTQIYHIPLFRFMEVVLMVAVIYHAVNGLRIILIDFWPEAAVYNRQLTWAAAIVFAVLAVPAVWIMVAAIVRHL
ncbi:MAG TPA: succinate dehydrogenase, cytochrome b556 subunit [Limnochordia bacterium]